MRNEVRRSRLQPIDQGHPTTVPAGTSPATSCAGDCANSRKSGRLRLAPFERRSVDPDAMEDDGDLARDRNLRRTPHAFKVDHFLVRCTSTLAASNRYVRNKRSPHREILPVTSVSPDCLRRGVRPRYAPTFDADVGGHLAAV